MMPEIVLVETEKWERQELNISLHMHIHCNFKQIYSTVTVLLFFVQQQDSSRCIY